MQLDHVAQIASSYRRTTAGADPRVRPVCACTGCCPRCAGKGVAPPNRYMQQKRLTQRCCPGAAKKKACCPSQPLEVYSVSILIHRRPLWSWSFPWRTSVSANLSAKFRRALPSHIRRKDAYIGRPIYQISTSDP